MSDIPDKVIEQATRAAFMAGDDQEQYVHGFAPDDFEPWRWSSSELMSPSEATVAAAAPVIAAWAREQVRAEVSRRYGEAEATYETVQGSYEQGRMDALGELLTVLDREQAQF